MLSKRTRLAYALLLSLASAVALAIMARTASLSGDLRYLLPGVPLWLLTAYIWTRFRTHTSDDQN
jgi:hypothetical protein